MDYTEARKLAQADKPKENFLKVQVDYNRWVVLPYKAGLQFLDALSHAQEFKAPYNAPPYIGPLQGDLFIAAPISASEFERYRIAMLLQVSMDDLAKAEQLASQRDPS